MLSGNLRAIIKRDHHLYNGVSSVQTLPRANRKQFGLNFSQNFRNYQDAFTVARITQLDVLTFKYKFLMRKLLRLRRFLRKQKILDQVENVQQWHFYRCSNYSRWIQQCSKVVVVLNNFQSQNFLEGQLRTQDEVREQGVQDEYNLPYILYQLSQRLYQEYDIIIQSGTLFRTIRGQIKNGSLIIPNILLSLVQRQKQRKLIKINKVFGQISQCRREINEIADLISVQKNKMKDFVGKFRPEIPFARRPFARKTAPVTSRSDYPKYRKVQFPRSSNNLEVELEGEEKLELNVNGVYKQVPDEVEEIVVVVNHVDDDIGVRIKEQSEYDADD